MSIPTRKSVRWNSAETEQLLEEIRNKKSVKDIATAHSRTTTSIMNRLTDLAVDYHFFDELPNEEITALTGLTHKQIVNAVERRKAKIMLNERQKPVEAPVEAPVEEKLMEISPELKHLPTLILSPVDEMPTLADVFKLLKDIQKKVEVLERVRVRLETTL